MLYGSLIEENPTYALKRNSTVHQPWKSNKLIVSSGLSSPKNFLSVIDEEPTERKSLLKAEHPDTSSINLNQI